MKNFSIGDIENADYSTLVGIVRERNRPSGGIRTLLEFAQKAFLSPGKNVLEVGSNTGFSVVNLANLTGANCFGIDINPLSVQESQSYAKDMNVNNLAEFKQGSALNIPHPDAYFDALWVSNVTSFIEDKKSAFNEYFRVLKNNGFIGIAPIYYRSTPPESIVSDVEKWISAKINIKTLDLWREEIIATADKNNTYIVECSCDNFTYEDQSLRIQEWLKYVLDKPHLREMPEDIRAALRDRYSECMNVFNENLKYCGFSLLVYQKRPCAEEKELFLTRHIS